MIQVKNNCDIPKHIVWECQINELKRLQKEIDAIQGWFLLNSHLDFDEDWAHKLNEKKQLVSKIKQIIEEL